MQQLSRYLLALILVLNLSACSTISGWFESDEDEATAPAELTEIEDTVNIEELWSVGIGNGQGKGFYRLRPVISGDIIYVASADGEVAALDRARGKTLWETDVETALSGGVDSGSLESVLAGSTRVISVNSRGFGTESSSISRTRNKANW